MTARKTSLLVYRVRLLPGSCFADDAQLRNFFVTESLQQQQHEGGVQHLQQDVDHLVRDG